ncbi:SDR family NAD(P)-dependent oxidoreductase [Halalkalibacter alkalisediminis]|uniref:SDR family NAD(P)-dependent oxidoreductase n=1 Tax=Halalkalibacter alkalisediminis TaxID=935616 RepID=A0ABV6N9R2_9BACI|nr:SDR family NAD(P)-dependent oxidoreductase [Halalkalibacter alkalisediminis]
MNYVVVTGSSKGLGEAIVKQLIERGDTSILCVARSNNRQLAKLANEHKVPYEFFPFDLNHLQDIPELMQSIFSKVRFADTN